MAYAFYTRPRGGDMISIEERWTRSDTVDIAYIRHSRDYGQTWTAPIEMRTGEPRPAGMLRRHPRCGFAEPHGRYLEYWNEGVLPSDDPLEGLRQWNIHYRVSRDGGRSFTPPRQVTHTGTEFHARHPFPGVWTGKNCVMLGDMACAPIAAPDGRILLPVQITPLAPDGSLFNPGGGSTYTDAAVLLGRWQGDALEWEMSGAVHARHGRRHARTSRWRPSPHRPARLQQQPPGTAGISLVRPLYRWRAPVDQTATVDL
jgi:hypothetical protein